MKNYVVGFAFSPDVQEVALIKKQRPDWQKDKFNGIGGHIEENEVPLDAMRREFLEEAGVEIYTWKNFLTVQYHDCIVYFFMTKCGSLTWRSIETMTDEKIFKVWVNTLNGLNIIPNLAWIIPLALDPFIHQVQGIGK